MIINPTKIYDEAKRKYYICLLLIVLSIISGFVIPISYIYFPIILGIGLIYQLYRYSNRMHLFVFLHGIKEIETTKFFRWLEDKDRLEYEDIGFF